MFEWISNPIGSVARAVGKAVRRKQPVRIESAVAACKGVGDLVALVRRDYQAVVTYRFLQGRLQKAAIRFEANPDKPRAVEVAKHLNSQLAKQFHHISEAPEFGRYTFVVNWANEGDATLGSFTFIDYFTQLASGKFALYSELSFDSDPKSKTYGEFLGVRVFDGQGTDPIPPDICGYFAFWATSGNPYGRSIYAGATQDVVEFRSKTLKPLRKKWLQKCVVPLRMVRAPEIVKDPETGEDVDNWSAIDAELEQAEAGGYVFFPPERDSKNEYTWSLDPAPTVADPSGLEDVVTNTDAEVSRSLGVNEDLVSRTTSGGSNAASEVGLQTADAVADDLASMIVSGLDSGWLQPHLERNGLSEGDIVITRKILLDENSTTVKVAASLLTNNTVPPFVISGAVDVGKILRDSGIPLAPGAVEAVDRLLTKMEEGTLVAGSAGVLGASGKVPAAADGQPQNGGSGPQKGAESNVG